MMARAWGSPDRYYAEAKGTPHGTEDDPASRRWIALLRAAEPEIVERVKRAQRQWNTIIRDHLRNETGLRLIHGTRQVSVPIKISDAIPAPLASILADSPNLAPLLLSRNHIAGGVLGLQVVRNNFELAHSFLTSRKSVDVVPATENGLAASSDFLEALLSELDRLGTIKKIWRLEIDSLGAYFFRRHEIELYWPAIGILSLMSGLDIEALTVVTLTHELAHAYTHVGRDIDGNQWNTEAFAKSDAHIVEGIAQHYTGAVCQRLAVRYPALLAVFREMLVLQSSPYTCFVEWTKNRADPGEHVRQWLIETRKRPITSYDDFTGMASQGKSS